jgi:outer membrane protein assembly factor BamB
LGQWVPRQLKNPLHLWRSSGRLGHHVKMLRFLYLVGDRAGSGRGARWCNGLSAAALLASGAAGMAADWDQYRGPQSAGIAAETIQPGWAGAPKCLWRAPTTAGLSSFAVGGGKAFTVVARSAEGGLAEVCLALDGATGKELWATPTGVAKYQGGADSGTPDNKGGDGPRSTPAVSAGRVFVYSAAMVLQCLDAGSGKPLWKQDIIASFGGQNIGWLSAMSPVLDGGLVYVAGGGAGQSLLAFKQSTGELAWKSGEGAITHATPAVATIHGVRQVIYLLQTGLVSVEAATGKRLWQFPFPYRTCTGCTPVVAGDIIFCTAGYDIGGAACQVVRKDGGFEAKPLWKVSGNKDLASLWSTPVQKDGFLYGMISFKRFGSGPLKCVDLKSGAVRWEKPGFGAGQVILAGGYLLALADDGQLVVVEAVPEAYKEVARFKALAGKCWSTPALSNGRLYVRSTREGACFDLSAKR